MKRIDHIHGITGAGYIEINIRGMFPCDKCDREFKSRIGLGIHISIKHLGKKKVFHNERKKQIGWNKGMKGLKYYPPKPLSEFPYTRVFLNRCKQTNIIWWDTVINQYHSSAKLEFRTYRAKCRFRFNVFDYPDLFDLELVEKYGWYSPNGYKSQNKKRNLGGVSRDHLYSIKDGYDNKVDPELLAHPVNCRIVKHYDNNVKKGRKSSITLDELKERIRIFEEETPYVSGRCGHLPVLTRLETGSIPAETPNF